MLVLICIFLTNFSVIAPNQHLGFFKIIFSFECTIKYYLKFKNKNNIFLHHPLSKHISQVMKSLKNYQKFPSCLLCLYWFLFLFFFPLDALSMSLCSRWIYRRHCWICKQLGCANLRWCSLCTYCFRFFQSLLSWCRIHWGKLIM